VNLDGRTAGDTCLLARTGTGTGMGRAGAEAAHGLTTPELLESKLAPKEVLIPSSSSGISRACRRVARDANEVK